MKISAREEYGLRCLVQLAREHAEPGAGVTLSAREISEREGLSSEYAAQILSALRRAGLVDSLRGVNGGFRLTKPATEMTVGEMFHAFEGPFADSICDSYTGQLDTCANAGHCDVAPVWQELSTRIYGFLDSLSIADVAAGALRDEPQIVPLTSLKRR